MCRRWEYFHQKKKTSSALLFKKPRVGNSVTVIFTFVMATFKKKGGKGGRKEGKEKGGKGGRKEGKREGREEGGRREERREGREEGGKEGREGQGEATHWSKDIWL